MSERWDWSQRRNLLCVRLDNLGDVLMTSPALRALKAHTPDRRLTLLTSHMGSGIARLIPEVDDVIEFDVPWVRLERSDTTGDKTLALINELRSRQFDAAVIFTVFSQNPLPAALLCYLAGIPACLGYCRENPYGLMSHWVPDSEPFSGIAHEVERQLALVRRVGASTADTALSLRVPQPTLARVARALVALGLRAHQFLVVHPGVSEPKRLCSPDVVAEAVLRLCEQGYPVVLTGTQGEAELVESIRARSGGQAISLAGKLGLEEFAALISLAAGLVSNNTGPVHIAAAAGTPVVVLYALTNPQHTPWQVPHRVLYFDVPKHLRSRSPVLQATYASMKAAVPQLGVSAGDIVQAVNELLADQLAPLTSHEDSHRPYSDL